MAKTTFTSSFAQNCALLDEALRVDKSFDLVTRNLIVAERRARLYFIDGMTKDENMTKLMQFWLGLTADKLKGVQTTRDFADRFVAFTETDVTAELETAQTFILSGMMGALVEGFSELILIDVRAYPNRGVGEPENDKVLRGAHDGFTETLIFNTALIRRRTRNPMLTMEYVSVGRLSRNDACLCYIADRVEPKTLEQLRERLKKIKLSNLVMGQESVAEALLRKQHFNPFPKVRYTERPDTAAASINEGGIVLLVDNSPSAILASTGVFDYLQDTNDYYFPPIVGTYLRVVRMLIFALTLLLTPIWLLLIQNESVIPHWLSFIKIADPYILPPFAQLLVGEIVIDALKLASLNTPSALSNSLSIVGALVLGEFAVRAGWMSAEVVLYMSFVAISNFTQPSYELAYAFKLCRMALVVLVALFDLWGFIAGIVGVILLIALNPTLTGQCYLYPLIPFDGKKLSRLLVRRKLDRYNN
ncbi:MAG: spore germination protein [Clostridia bacterium]|nr:spore germination protein [Clostridia bacterium]